MKYEDKVLEHHFKKAQLMDWNDLAHKIMQMEFHFNRAKEKFSFEKRALLEQIIEIYEERKTSLIPYNPQRYSNYLDLLDEDEEFT